jgi:hypothetical protein
MPYIHIDIDLSDFSIDDLIEEVESAGYTVLDEDEKQEAFLDKEELEYLIEKLSGEKIGSIGWNAVEKLRAFHYKSK